MNIVHERFSKIKQQKLYHNYLFVLKNLFIFAPLSNILSSKRKKGALAQLARVLDWQSRGHRFDSGMLHLIIKTLQRCKVFLI
jgi:hypothetical protein